MRSAPSWRGRPPESPRRPSGPRAPHGSRWEASARSRLQSVQLPASTGGAGSGSGGRRREKPAGGQLTFTSRVGPHSSALFRASTEGKGMNGQVDFPTALHLELSNAIVSSYQVSRADDGDTETWTLDVESIEFVARQPEEPHADRQEQGG
jgi:type VI protein secretion system component Hcp